MPRQRPLPLDDALLDKEEASALVKVSSSRWDAYAERFQALLRGRRLVQVTPGGRGSMRWLKSAVIEHVHRELPRERTAAPVSLVHDAGKRSGDLAGPMSRRARSDSAARNHSVPVRDVRGTPPAPVTNAACSDRGSSRVRGIA